MAGEEIGAAYVKIGVDSSGIKSGMAAAKREAVSGATGMSAGIRGALSKGDMTGVGTKMGDQLVGGMSSRFGMLGGLAGNLATALGPVGIAVLGIGAALGVVALGLGKCVSAAADWQMAMVEVRKVTTATDAEFEKLSTDLLEIRAQTGASKAEITAAAAGAGRMGIDQSQIAGYTESIIQMGAAWGTSAEFASSAVGKLGSVLKPAEMSWKDFANAMGSTINDLADSMATSEEAIVIGIKKVTAQMAMLKPTKAQISEWLAFTAQLQAWGMTSSTAGESFKQVLVFAMRDAKGAISDMLDIDPAEFQARLREDAIGTLEDLAKAIYELPLDEQGLALAKFGETGGQAMGMLVGKIDPIAGEIDGLSSALETGHVAWEKSSSLSEAFADSQATLNSQFDIFKGQLDVAATKAGTVLLPALTKVMVAVNDLTGSLIKLGSAGWGALSGLIDVGGEALGGVSGFLERDVRGSAWGQKVWGPLGEDYGEGFESGAELAEKVETDLEGVDAKGPGKSAGEAFGAEFVGALGSSVTEYVSSGLSKDVMDSMHKAGMRPVMGETGEGWGLIRYRSQSGSETEYKPSTEVEYGGKEYDVAQAKSKWTMSEGKYKYQYKVWLEGEAAIVDWAVSPEDAVTQAIEQKDWKVEPIGVEAEIRINPYESFDTSAHMADFWAENSALREEYGDMFIMDMYNLHDRISTEGKEGYDDAWERLLDPESTNAQIAAAASYLDLSPIEKELLGQVRDIGENVSEVFRLSSIDLLGAFQTGGIGGLMAEAGKAGIYDLPKFFETRRVAGLTRELQTLIDVGVDPLTSGLERATDAMEEFYALRDIALGTEGVLNPVTDYLLTNFDPAEDDINDFIILLGVLRGEITETKAALTPKFRADEDDWLAAPISDFAKWQETTPGLFFADYFGPESGWAGRGMGAKTELQIETAEAEAEMKKFTSEADLELNKLVAKANGPYTMVVKADTSQATKDVEALNTLAGKGITKTITIRTVHEGGGYSPSFGGGSWLSMAGGGIASSPIPAMVGDASTPEVIAPLGDLLPMIQQAVVGGGGTTINLNIEGNVTEDTMPHIEAKIDELALTVARAVRGDGLYG